MKTFKQLADELGVSKQSVYKRYKGRLRNDLKEHVSSKYGTLIIDEEGEEIIINDYKTPLNTFSYVARGYDNEELNAIKSTLDEINNKLDTLMSREPVKRGLEKQELREEKTIKKQETERQETVKKPKSNTILATAKDEDIIKALEEGKSYKTIVDELKTSPSRISKIKKKYNIT